MAQGTLHFLGENPKFTVSADQVYGQGGANAPVLIIPMKLEFSSMGRQRNGIERADILTIKGEIKATEKNVRASETIAMLTYPISKNNLSNETHLQFHLTPEIINRIEKYRKGDLAITLTVTVQAGLYKAIGLSNGESQLFITGFENSNGYIVFQIPQSQWVKEILPLLGHNSFKLIELPAINDIIPKEYNIALTELDQARNYFLNGDYDKTVAHCRSALDPFREKRGEIKTFIKSKSEFEWANDVLDATDAWLLKLIKSTSHFTSKAHHSPSVGHFGRTEAEIIMMVTTALIAYVGKIEGSTSQV